MAAASFGTAGSPPSPSAYTAPDGAERTCRRSAPHAEPAVDENLSITTKVITMKLSLATGLLLTCAAVGGTALVAGPALADEVRWTAVAVSTSNGLLNASRNYTDVEEAKNTALADCDHRVPPPAGSSAPAHDCRLVLVYPSGRCGAVATGTRYSDGDAVGTTYSWSVGNSLSEADFDAIMKNPGLGVTVWWSDCQY